MPLGVADLLGSLLEAGGCLADVLLGCGCDCEDRPRRRRARAKKAGRRDPLGPRAERRAATHLRRHGCRVLRRNLRLAPGEIDILAETPDGGALIVVEVKCRRTRNERGEGLMAPTLSRLPPPEASITAAKRAKLLALAGAVGRLPLARGRPVRIDVIAVDWPDRGAPVIRWHANAVTR